MLANIVDVLKHRLTFSVKRLAMNKIINQAIQLSNDDVVMNDGKEGKNLFMEQYEID